jgi:hypothetical protein
MHRDMKSDLSSLEMQQVSYLLLGRCVKLLGLSHDACDMPTIETVTVADKQGYEYDGDVNKWHFDRRRHWRCHPYRRQHSRWLAGVDLHHRCQRSYDRCQVAARGFNQDMSERRATQRRRTLKAGKIFINGGRSVIDCTVRNVSDTGALISVLASAVPAEFDLLLDGRTHRCIVVRRKPDRLGIKFQPPPRCLDGSGGEPRAKNNTGSAF